MNSVKVYTPSPYYVITNPVIDLVRVPNIGQSIVLEVKTNTWSGFNTMKVINITHLPVNLAVADLPPDFKELFIHDGQLYRIAMEVI